VRPVGGERGSRCADWTHDHYFDDASLVETPTRTSEDLRADAPCLTPSPPRRVRRDRYDEANEIYRDPDTFSSCNSWSGRAGVPVPLEGDDVSEIVNRYRNQLPMNVAHGDDGLAGAHAGAALADAVDHSEASQGQRGVHVRLADQQLDELIPTLPLRVISKYAQPFAMLVVADLLGVPDKIINGSASSSA